MFIKLKSLLISVSLVALCFTSQAQYQELAQPSSSNAWVMAYGIAESYSNAVYDAGTVSGTWDEYFVVPQWGWTSIIDVQVTPDQLAPTTLDLMTNIASGFPGAAGATGPQGTPGIDGTNGSPGAAGATGATGTVGAQGPIGLTGPTGPQGASGTNGATGATGASGSTGATGATGSQGAAGTNGTNGASPIILIGTTTSISSGSPSVTDTVTGPTNLFNFTLLQGATGATGPQGPAGSTGVAGSTGATGSAGAVGATGSTGPTGPTGATGAAGANGTNSKLIQDVRLQTDAAGNFSWTYPTAYGAGTNPVVQIQVESPSTNVLLNVQIIGTPSNTGMTGKVWSLPSISVLTLLVLGSPVGYQSYVHVFVAAP